MYAREMWTAFDSGQCVDQKTRWLIVCCPYVQMRQDDQPAALMGATGDKSPFRPLPFLLMCNFCMGRNSWSSHTLVLITTTVHFFSLGVGDR